MKHLVTIILFNVLCLTANAQTSDFYTRQARSYQREAAYYMRQADSYQREADYYNRQTQGNLREAEYYTRQKNMIGQRLIRTGQRARPIKPWPILARQTTREKGRQTI